MYNGQRHSQNSQYKHKNTALRKGEIFRRAEKRCKQSRGKAKVGGAKWQKSLLAMEELRFCCHKPCWNLQVLIQIEPLNHLYALYHTFKICALSFVRLFIFECQTLSIKNQRIPKLGLCSFLIRMGRGRFFFWKTNYIIL